MLARALLPSHDCATCTPALKKQRGCDAPPYPPAELDGARLDRCPLRPYKDDPAPYDDALALYAHYQRGFLPDPGTVLDQSQPFLAAMSTIEGALRGAQEQRARRERSAHEAAQKLEEAKKAGSRQARGRRC